MRKSLPTVSTQTEELAFPELELPIPPKPPPRAYDAERRPADRIKEALLRWLEEEL